MKQTFLMIAIALTIGINGCGQSGKNVPASVKESFSKKFPDVSNVKWGKENDKEWEAEFKMDGKEYSANFDNSGTWIETEYEISKNEIPETVKTTIDKDFQGYKIVESEISETINGKVYEFLVKKDKQKLEVGISITGEVLNKEQVTEETEKD